MFVLGFGISFATLFLSLSTLIKLSRFFLKKRNLISRNIFTPFIKPAVPILNEGHSVQRMGK